MKLKFNLKQKITEVAEQVYDLAQKDIHVDIDKTKVSVKQARPTKHTIKWRAKNH